MERLSVEMLLPHRGRWLLLDEIIVVKDNFLVAKKTFTEKECEGHFPQVVPGHLICEALAQAAASLVSLKQPEVRGKKFFLTETEAKFLQPVEVNTEIILQVSLKKQKAIKWLRFCFFEGEARVQQDKVSVRWKGSGSVVLEKL
jgi:3-hydroxymyristoyl/3-hydroxydecanoyl-(acyl carrier protein) dehydratase